jgi:hypothetical protein
VTTCCGDARARVVQRSAAQCSAAQRSAAQCSAVQRSAVQRSAAQRSAAQCSAAQCSAVQRSAAQRSAAQCSAAQCSAAQCSAVQLISMLRPGLCVFAFPLQWLVPLVPARRVRRRPWQPWTPPRPSSCPRRCGVVPMPPPPPLPPFPVIPAPITPCACSACGCSTCTRAYACHAALVLCGPQCPARAQVVADHDIIVFTSGSREELLRWNNFCRNHSVVVGNVRGEDQVGPGPLSHTPLRKPPTVFPAASLPALWHLFSALCMGRLPCIVGNLGEGPQPSRGEQGLGGGISIPPSPDADAQACRRTCSFVRCACVSGCVRVHARPRPLVFRHHPPPLWMCAVGRWPPCRSCPSPSSSSPPR